jgi:hypothetical protein
LERQTYIHTVMTIDRRADGQLERQTDIHTVMTIDRQTDKTVRQAKRQMTVRHIA